MNDVNSAGITAVRLDERLIHGQVAAVWTRTMQITRIMVVDDEIIHDEIGKIALKSAVPIGIKLSILSVESAAKKILEGQYAGQRVLIVVNKPSTISRLLNSGVFLSEVNIGNMGMKEGRKAIKKSVYCTEKEIEEILKIEEHGTKVYAQMVPNEEKKIFKSFLE
ncbi:MAG: PTS sugar transporter subunit IIB [Erysipelotrichaceae bacterium]|nr:PTS sugar transporter subunit IIB [Erysipelotrichaceae bacterium]